jgi:hypothetical protein
MKTYLKILTLFVALCAVSCTEDTQMITVINPDGTCYREFTAEVDSSFMVGNQENTKPFPVLIDSTWEVTWTFRNLEPSQEYPILPAVFDSIVRNVPADTANGTKPSRKFQVRIRRNYQSVEDMAATFRLRDSHEWKDMKVRYSLEKKFRWFHTDYTFKEVYPKIETGWEIPLDSFMTNDEAKFWLTGTPNVLQGMNGIEIRNYVGDLEDKFNHWYVLNSWNVEYKALLTHYDSISKPPVDKVKLAALRDTIYKAKVHGDEDINMKDVLNDYFHTKAFSVLWENQDSPMNKYEKSLEEEGYVHYFVRTMTYNLVMPGTLTPPENTVVHGDTATWNLTAYRMVYGDYVLEAHSRKANVWAYLLTGLLIVVAIGSFIYKPKKRIRK